MDLGHAKDLELLRQEEGLACLLNEVLHKRFVDLQVEAASGRGDLACKRKEEEKVSRMVNLLCKCRFLCCSRGFFL